MSDKGDTEPQWLKSPPQEDRSSRRSSSGTVRGASEDGQSKSRASLGLGGKARRSNTAGGYHSEEDNDFAYGDGVCCCSMDPLLLGIVFFQGICGCLGIAGVVANIQHITHPVAEGQYQDIIMRAYSMSFCCIIVLCEIDWRFFMRYLRLLDLWIFRGLFYMYAGLQTIDKINGFDADSLSTIGNATGITIIISGVIYMIMGACCVKSIAESRRRLERERYREIDPDSLMETV